MRLHYITISIFIVSAMVLGFINFATELGDNYSATADFTGLEKTQTRLETQQQNVQDLSDAVEDMTLELNAIDLLVLPYKMVKVGWFAAKSIFNSWVTVGTMIEESGTGLAESGIPLPEWLIPTFIGILTIILIAILIYAFFKWQFGD